MAAIVISVVVMGVAAVVRYVRLVRLSALAEETWNDIRLLLKRRSELIPAIADTVQHYAASERQLYWQLVQAQKQAARTVGVAGRWRAEQGLQAVVQELLARSEAYPQLQAHTGLRELRGELLDIDMRLRRTAKLYNQAVDRFNRRRRLPPARLLARLAGQHSEREPLPVV